MCELLRKIAAQGLVGPITLVLDNARYQRMPRCRVGGQLGIRLLFLPSYSPNLNLIERLWSSSSAVALRSLSPDVREFQGAIQETLDGLLTFTPNN